MKKNYCDLIWGVLFIIAGIIIGGNIANIWYIDLFFPGWWTLFLIIPGLAGMIQHGFNWGYGALVIVGLILLFDRLGIINSGFMWSLIFPLIFILIGLTIISSFIKGPKDFETKQEKGYKDPSGRCDSNRYSKYVTILTGGEYRNNSDDLKGVVALTILGGLDIDLRDAKINQDIVLDLTVVLGGMEILMPDNVNVEIISANPILGGFDAKVRDNNMPGPKVKIKYTVILGGIEIK